MVPCSIYRGRVLGKLGVAVHTHHLLSIVLQRDDWLMGGGESFVPTFSRDDLRARIKQDKEEKSLELAALQQQQQQNDVKSEKYDLDKPGLHRLELNPFWKDGGTGLPTEDGEQTAVSSGIGDGGVAWLKQAFRRCQEQAKEEGRSLEELAAHRWGVSTV